MVTTDQVQSVLEAGGSVTGHDGSKIGKVGQIFLDDDTSEPAWVTVKTGMFGGAESFVPLQRSSISGDDIEVPFDKDMVKDAPRVEDADGHLSKDEEAELYRYYGMDYADTTHSTGRGDQSGHNGQVERTEHGDHADRSDEQGTVGHDTSGPTTDNAMTRSEERLDVGTETVSAGKVRLRKYVVTENVTKTVPVSHEEVRIEREPITDANRGDAMSGGDITSEEHEIELTKENVVVDKETVPVERVQMGTETVTEDHEVTEQIRKEQIDTDDLDARRDDSSAT